MINSEPYNKFINTKDGIDGESYLVYLKQDNIDLFNHFANKNNDLINSWSSKKHDHSSWSEVMKIVEERRHQRG